MTLCKFKRLPILLLILLTACEQKTDQLGGEILAKVGQTEIRTQEFINSYNAGSSSLKDIDHPMQSFLDAMIAEELLAAELKNDSIYSSNMRITKALRLLKQELVVEQMFKSEVHDQIVVTDEEIKEAIEKSRLSIRANFIISQDRNAMMQCLQKLDGGLEFDRVQSALDNDIRSIIIFDSTDYVREGELPEPLNAQLFDLKVNTYSDIISIGNAYAIAYCNDRLQEIIDPNDYQKYHDRFYKVLDHRKRLASSRLFIKDFMDPLDIQVEGEVFAFMVNSLYDLYVNLPLEEQAFSNHQNPEYEITAEAILNEIDRRGEEVAVRSNQGDITVQILLEQLLLKPFYIEAESKHDFAAELRQEIGIALRDYYLEKEGIQRGFDRDRTIQSELASWEEKLIVQAFIEQVKLVTTPDDLEMQNYIQAQQLSLKPGDARWNQLQQRLTILRSKEVLDERVDSLKSDVEIEVFSDELSKLEIDNPGKAQGLDTYFFKLGLPYLRSAFATPDPIWGL